MSPNIGYDYESEIDERDEAAGDPEADDEDFDEFDETDVFEKDFSEAASFDSKKIVHDSVGDQSVVFQMEDIMAEVEEEANAGGSAAARVRKRLEAIAERKRRRQELEDFEDYDVDA